jgi:alanine-glyoxylate transaminase/serine-glyoxylate transaminase/serine-pyruvate transaminase
VPERVLGALSRPTIDHRGPEFAALTEKVLAQLKRVFQTEQPVIVYPSSGTGAWEAALANCLSPGDRVLAFETGHFATLWRNMATGLGLEVDFVPGDWRHGVDPRVAGERLAADRTHAIAAVTVVHNETSTGVRSRIPEIRAAMDRAGHPALLLADTGIGLGQLAGRAFRIGHLGHLNEATLAGVLAGVELGLQAAGVPIKPGGVTEALAVLARQ